MGIDYQRLYEYRFRDVDQVSRQAVWREIAADIYRRMGAPTKVLDPAAGRCEFINAVPAAERWAVDTVDHNEFRHPDIKVIIADILDADLPADYFDGVFVSNFLEHLPSQDAVGTVLAKLRESMEPGGTIAVLGPNFRYCANEYFDCADHTLALTHVAVVEHLYAAGFRGHRGYPAVPALLFPRPDSRFCRAGADLPSSSLVLASAGEAISRARGQGAGGLSRFVFQTSTVYGPTW